MSQRLQPADAPELPTIELTGNNIAFAKAGF